MSNALIRLNQEEKIFKSLQLYPPKSPTKDNNNIGNEDKHKLIEIAFASINPILKRLIKEKININREADSAM